MKWFKKLWWFPFGFIYAALSTIGFLQICPSASSVPNLKKLLDELKFEPHEEVIKIYFADLQKACFLIGLKK